MSSVLDLEPKAVWSHFAAMAKIPHTSKNEAKIADYVVACAAKLGLACKRDAVGNVLVVKPATAGKESVAVTVLQGHLDMVGVKKPGSAHDFDKDPIRLSVEGDYLRAIDTTLGADNGIGGAMMLALMEADGIPHGKLEFFFTIDEEAGMTGAHNVSSDFLSGKRLLNLDTEEWGAFYISCAGGGDSVITLPLTREAFPNAVAFELSLTGLKGGHSGADINLGRGSATKLMARLLYAVREAVGEVRIAELSGGSKRNSIAAEAKAVFLSPADKCEAAKAAVQAMTAVLTAEYAKTDEGLQIEVRDIRESRLPFSKEHSNRIIDLLTALPQGVTAMSPEVKDLVETSTNIGVITTHDDVLTVSMLTRSAVDTRLDALKAQLKTIARLVGADVREPLGYPGWKPDMNSYLLQRAKTVYTGMYQQEPKICAIHAGLECGIFSRTFPGIDMLSIGPEIHGAHSPAEEVYIPSVKTSWEFLIALLKAME